MPFVFSAITISTGGTGGSGLGGAVVQSGAQGLTILASTLATNTSKGGRGGNGGAGYQVFWGDAGAGGTGGGGGGGGTAQRGTGAGSTLLVANSTLYANTAGGGDGGTGGTTSNGAGGQWQGGNGGTGGNGSGGGAHNGGNLLTLLNATIAANSVTGGNGGARGTGPVNGSQSAAGTLHGGGANNSGTGLRTTNAIIANSPAGGNCAGTITDNHNNLEYNPPTFLTPLSCGFTIDSPYFDQIGDPLLGPLADNGGPTQTMALNPGSPAIDHGDNTACAGTPVSNRDQRGGIRPIGAACDIGAFEAGAITLSALSPTSGPATGGSAVTIRGSGFGGATSVSFGGGAATVTNVAATTITVKTPMHDAGTVDVW